jgi:protein kinase-like protein/sulfatase-modifying factor enzyme 1
VADKVKCQKCGTANAVGQPVCHRCGATLPRVRMQAGAPPAGQSEPDAEPASFRRGQVVAGRYSVQGIIGRGGMGCIYSVYDNTLKENCALKTLLPQFIRDKLVVDRFYNEARIARQLSHKNIIRVHDIGIADGSLYISMEYVEGQSLRAKLDSYPAGDRMPVKEALLLLDTLCVALEYAHQYTVHRDIKPENVMLSLEGEVKLMDFGISKLMTNTGLTMTSVVMGTPYYMSPEQLRDSSTVDARADIYSLGVMLYEILTGNVPTGVPKPASQLRREIPPALDPIVAKCVAQKPGDRYQDIAELRADIRPLIKMLSAGASSRALARPKADKAPLPLRRIGGVAAALLIVAGAAFGFWRAEQVRGNLVANAGAATSTAPGPASSLERRFDRIEGLKIRAQVLAETKAGGDAYAKWIVEEGDTRWTAAQDHWEIGKQADACLYGIYALQCYAGVIRRSRLENMVFIPPEPALIPDMDGVNDATVELDAFFMDATEVTIGQYRDFAALVRDGWPSPRSQTAEDFPVTNVSFYDALAYATWAGKELPTEAQWAKAACATEEGVSYYAWDGEFPELEYDPESGRPIPVVADGQVWPVLSSELDSSYWGCYDLSGNVAEWTRSLYRPLPYDPEDGREDLGAAYFTLLMAIRGGHYGSPQTSVLERGGADFSARAPWLGFRCAITVPSDLDDLEDWIEES